MKRIYRTVVLGKSGKPEVIFNRYSTFHESLNAARILIQSGIGKDKIDIEKLVNGEWRSYEQERR